ncbi:MAG: GNAT family N-acetyltransferase [Chloroflexota bacterium]
MTTINMRKARHDDRGKIITVEAGSMPHWRYVDHVFDQFMADPRGEFSVAELDGEVVGCAKLTVMPSEPGQASGWLETLRVTPARQGMGIGKRLYQRFFEVAHREGLQTMRMYTGVNNAVSKGLAEHFGFQADATFYGASLLCDTIPTSVTKQASSFTQVTDAASATELLMPHSAEWNGYVVMNRTFYTLAPALCRYLAQQGHVYEDRSSGSVLAMGARFMPQQALHIGLFAGDAEACLDFAMHKAIAMQTERVSCFFPTQAVGIQQPLEVAGFQFAPAAFVVMAIHL